MTDALAHTPLHDEHVRLGARMVPFAGYEMPVQYPTGITTEHRAVREACGLFDVSHMGEFVVEGRDALEAIQRVTVNDAGRVEVGQAQYTAMVREDGGILDDLIVYRFDDHWMVVVNAANRTKDLEWIRSHTDDLDVEVEDRSEEIGLLAVQGPKARDVVQALSDDDLDAIGYYRFARATVAGVHAIVSGTGYTGEDGFELYVDAVDAPGLWRALLDVGGERGLIATGLGARDSLRLEVGYALYGNDLDEEHTPLEAGLGWITKLGKGDFIGREALAAQKERGVARKLVGLRLTERGFPRPGYPIVRAGSDGTERTGEVTSGTVSPSLGVGIALGYVEVGDASPGTELAVEIRGEPVAATVERPPFYRDGSIRR